MSEFAGPLFILGARVHPRGTFGPNAAKEFVVKISWDFQALEWAYTTVVDPDFGYEEPTYRHRLESHLQVGRADG